MESNSAKRKSQGRRKIDIKKIGSKRNLQVTLTKRRKGLFGKAGELGAVCGSEVAILVQSPANKIFAFGYPSVESVIHKHESAGTTTGYNGIPLEGDLTDVKNNYFVAVARLEEQKRIASAAREAATRNNGRFWWDAEIEGMELHELEGYVEALAELLERVKVRAMEAKESEQQPPLASDSVGLPPDQNMGLNLAAFRDQIDYFMKNDAQEEETVREFWHFDDDLWGWHMS